jgi:hypothetical protein
MFSAAFPAEYTGAVALDTSLFFIILNNNLLTGGSQGQTENTLLNFLHVRCQEA